MSQICDTYTLLRKDEDADIDNDDDGEGYKSHTSVTLALFIGWR